jgi:hypothetical protein
MTAGTVSTLALLAGFVIDDAGTKWGAIAKDFQRRDAEAIVARSDDSARHFILRGRGMSKTTDMGGVSLALMLTEAPPRSRSYAYAVDADQAQLLHDAIVKLVRLNNLGSLVEVGSSAITIRATGATLSIEASDGASAYGLLPWMIVADEVGMWPASDNHRRLWGAIVSALPKVPGSRLVAIGHAGPPSGLGAEVWRRAEASPHWRTVRTPGPSPWWSSADTDAARADLTPSEWRRLILCEWAEGDEALTTAEDVAACIRSGSAVLEPKPAHDYVAALDVGTRADLTAFAIGHTERRDAGRTVVIDRVVYWRPGKGFEGRLDLSEVETTVLRLCREYGVRRLRFDRMQAEQLTSNVARAGVRVQEFVFSTAGVTRLARAMHVALRDRAIELPDDEEVVAEGRTVRLVETGPSTVKMQNPPGSHDDVFQAIAMVVVDLLEQPEVGFGSFSIPADILAARKLTTSALGPGGVPISPYLNPAYTSRAVHGELAAIQRAQRLQTPAQRAAGIGLVVPGNANDH